MKGTGSSLRHLLSMDMQLWWVMQPWQLQENSPKLVKVKLSLKTKTFKLTEVLVCLHNSIYTVGFAGTPAMMGRRKCFPLLFSLILSCLLIPK